MIINEDTAKAIKERYEAGEPVYKIAESLGTFPVTIKKALVNLGVPLRGRGKAKSDEIDTSKYSGVGEERKEAEKPQDDLLNANDTKQEAVKPKPEIVKTFKKPKQGNSVKTQPKKKIVQVKTAKKKTKKIVKVRKQKSIFKKFFNRVSKYLSAVRAIKF